MEHKAKQVSAIHTRMRGTRRFSNHSIIDRRNKNEEASQALFFTKSNLR